MAWEPRSCCGYGSVKIGTLALGWVGLIRSGLYVLCSLRFVGLGYEDYLLLCEEVIKKERQIDNISPDICAKATVSSVAVGAVFNFIGVIICILLLVGVNKGKPSYMIPFMVCQGFGIILLSLATPLLFGLLIYVGAVGVGFIFVIVFLLIIFLEVYFFLIVRVCYKEVVVKQQRAMMMGFGNENGIIPPYVEQPYKNK